VSGNIRELNTLALVSVCASDTQNAVAWTEFVRRFAPKIRVFIRGTLRQSVRHPAPSPGIPAPEEAAQENDLFQNTIVRLVENSCAALKRFTGESESDFLAYLAVVSRSAVRDFLRRRSATKRPLSLVPNGPRKTGDIPAPAKDPQLEREILGRELMALSERAIRSLSAESYERDWLIFQLYYYDDLSIHQIAQCRGVDLSKAGVEKVLNRMKERVRSIMSVNRAEAMIR
jgi:RNA polymerase sigma factor (sigma-70 family)